MFISLIIYNITKKKIKKRQIIISASGFSIVAFVSLAYFIKLILKIEDPANLRYIAFLINLLFIGFVSIDTFNKEYHDLLNLKDNLGNEVKERTEELVLAKEEIEKKEQQKTNYFINIAHETRTPLTLISNYMDKFLDKYKDSTEVKIVKQNIDKMKNDMMNFLDIEKLERGQIFYDQEQIVDFSEILEVKILLFEKIAEKKQIKIIIDIEKKVIIKIDPYALDRIINNLLDNAIKYSKKYGKIEVILKADKDKIIFSVADTGIGISEEQIEHIFKPYHQISNKKQNIQGIGLGLNIVKKIVDEINGEIKTESKENEGTKFLIILNKYSIKRGEQLITDYELTNPNDNIPINELKEEIYFKEKKNILIVEDNKDMLSYLQKNLHDDYNIFISLNGIEALNKINSIPKPDLIISDIMMDEMDGYEFYDELSKKPEYNDIPFIFLTAKTSNLEKLNWLKKGAVDYIFKPFLIEELKNKVNSLLQLIERQNKNIVININKKILNLLNEENNINNGEINFDIICSEYMLSKIEREIIKLLIKGLEYKEISAKLNLSIGTIRKKIHIIYKKFNIQNKIELVNIFNENNNKKQVSV